MSPTNISWIAMDQDGRYTYSFNPDGTPVGTISLAGLSKTGEESVDICVILLLLTALMCTYWILRDIHIKKDLFEKNQITMTR